MRGAEQQDYFLKLYEPIHDRFEHFCRARVYGNMDYEDLMNETLLIAFQKINTLKSEPAFLSFLIGISIRILANHHKKKKEDLIEEFEYLNIEDVNENSSKDAEVYLLYKALSLLPDNQKECIILFEISGFSIKEIMEIQQSLEPAIKQRLKRARAKLLELLSFESKYKTTEVKNG
jgi:RNA polymerase sigma-70 factor (ECF subfamily)